MSQESGIRVQASGFGGHLFHHSNFFYPFAKIFFLKIYLWNMEHRPSKCYYCCIPTLLNDFLVPNLFQRLEQITKYPINTTFFDFLKKSKMIKKVTIYSKLINNTNNYLTIYNVPNEYKI